MVADSTPRDVNTRVHAWFWPRLVVLYSPPNPLPVPPKPLRTAAYQVFCVGSLGSTSRSLVQYCIPPPADPAGPTSVRSAHVWPPSALTNTPLLAVNAPPDCRAE